ncbi:SDR family NAD(P)-dependent oxidoreductase [Halomicrobium mukohataei]|uniref:SDR family NAD(P)-dependent oxidoreductase n=1 Tax=Halomicrobium mukohataei TaxID=57705 RepID=A0A847U5V0_9EURY|nr:oxidoreductase [Halomicrobium mukohataei]NLV08675.1 SDR family NAD(P)-dependent oxidoreductase [Halomicrobium mukohataei]
MTDWTARDMPSLDDRTVVVTGANSGIGYEATKAFARRGATVVMACRSTERGERAAREIDRSVANADLDVMACDLADLDAVADFAEAFTSAYDELHVLCNNAGVMALPRGETADGFERQLGINHLGHFALTGHLLDTLAATDGARVVTQSSGAHQNGEIDFEDLQGERSYGRWSAYSQSKLANVLFGYELDRRADEAGIDVTSVVCHPGYADSDLQRRAGEAGAGAIGAAISQAANALVAQSAAQGALPMLYAATHDEISGGEYVGPGGLLHMRGAPAVQDSSARSYNTATASKLWHVSEDLTGVEYDFEVAVTTA